MKNNKILFIQITASVLLPILLMCIVYSAIGIFPFGPYTLFTNDMSYEYVGVFSYLGHILRGDADWLYTFSKVLGGDMAGLFGYYLLSPLNLLTIFFQPDEMPAFILVLTLLKIGLCGLTMNLYLRHRFDTVYTVLFSTCYAFMSYNMAYQQNIMWLDGVILLPLLVWGIDNILKNGQILLYTLVLALGLIANFYIGYMLCVFSVLYFCMHFLLQIKLKINKENGKVLMQFFEGSLLAGGIAAFWLIPTAMSLRGGKDEMHLGKLLRFELLHKPAAVLKNLLPGQFDIDGGIFRSPNIYCGLFILVFAVIYAAYGKAAWKERLANILLVVFLYISLLFKNFERAWHGFVLPTGYPHRYSFLLSFLLIVMAYAGWQAIMVVQLNEHQGIRKMLCIIICVCSLFELTINGTLILKCFTYQGKEAYQQSVKNDFSIIAEIKERDKGFYRMENIHGGSGMDNPMLMNYRGLASSYSGEKSVTKRTAGNMGMNEKTTWIAYHDQMSVGMESLLSLKYLIAGNNTDKEFYNIIQEDKDLTIYENPYTLPLGVMTDSAILKADIENRDMFAIQNEIWNSILRADGQLYEPIAATELYREDDGVTYEFTVQQSDVIYTNFFDEGLVDICRIYVNNQEQTSFKPEKMPYRIGRFRKGDILRVEIRSEEKNINWYDLYFYYENMDILNNNIDRIREESYQIEQFNEHSFKGKIVNRSNEERYALFTIPYDKGWKIKMDGKQIEPEKALNSLLCISIPEGEHELAMTFLPQGMLLGGVLTLFSLVILITTIRRSPR